MSKLEVTLYCGLCDKRHEQNIPMPAGWDSRYRSVSDEHAFCPKHAPISAFANSQCPGCVGDWGDCPLWKAFAYRELKLMPADFEQLATGICPRRVNGTMMVKHTKVGAEIENVDLRDSPIPAAGQALGEAIRDYAKRYHS